MPDAAFVLRRATPDDTDEVLELHLRSRAAYQRLVRPESEIVASDADLRERRDSYYAAALGSPDIDAFCAVLGDRIVGFTISGPCGHPDPLPGTTAELFKIHVDPGHWGLGIARRLLDNCVGRWRDTGVDSARLFVWEFNERARRFYARAGWVRYDHRRPDDPRIGPYRMLAYRLAVPAADGSGAAGGAGVARS